MTPSLPNTPPIAGGIDWPAERCGRYAGPLVTPSLRVAGVPVAPELGTPSQSTLAAAMARLVRSGALVSQTGEAPGAASCAPVAGPESRPAESDPANSGPDALSVRVGEVERQLAAASHAPGFDPLTVVLAETKGRYEAGTPGTWSEGREVSLWSKPFARPWSVEARPAVAYATAYRPWVCDPTGTLEAIEAAFGEAAAGAVLATVVQAVEPLVPAWGPEMALYVVQAYRWHGEEDDREMMEELRYQLAHVRGVEPEDVSAEDLAAEADGYYWTTEFVRSRLPKAYSDAEPLGPGAARALIAEARRRLAAAAQEGTPHEDAPWEHAAEGLARKGLSLTEKLLVRSVRCRRVCATLAHAYPIRDGSEDHVSPFGVVLDTDARGPAGAAEDAHRDSIVVETFEEMARHEHETGGDPLPLVGLGFDPAEPADVDRLKAFLRHVSLGEQACLHLLSLLCPGDFAHAARAELRGAGGEIRPAQRAVDARYADETVRKGSRSAVALASAGGDAAALPRGAVMLF